MPVMVNNIQDKVEIPEDFFSLLEEIGNFLLRLEGYSLSCELSIIFVDNSYIQELNLTYRGYDAPTDVLSFNLQDDIGGEGERILGDVVISAEKAREQAQTFNHTLKEEIAFLCVHGILHLLGYDHDTEEAEQEMNEKQDLVLKKFKLRS